MIEEEKQFMIAAGQTVENMNEEQAKLYEDLIDEETDEFQDACINEPLENQVKEACDILVVTINWLFSVGVNPLKVFLLVWKNNMAKVDGSYPIVKDPITQKVQKSSASIKAKKQMMIDIRAELPDE